MGIWMKKSTTGSNPLQILRGDKTEEMHVYPLMTFPFWCTCVIDWHILKECWFLL